IIADGMGGAIIVWEDPRVGADVYAQRVDGGGTVMWDPDGVEVCIAAYDQLNPALVSDGAEGAIVTWQDYRNNAHYDIYAQRIDGGGGVMWAPDGEPLCMNDGDQEEPVITTDMVGGGIITWLDARTDTNDVYAQRVDDLGNPVWQTDGEPICTVPNEEDRVHIVSDLNGGAIIAWQDHRTGVFLNYDIYAQRVDGSGTIMWTANGEAICTATQQQFPADMLTDGQGGAFIVWQDNRAVSGYDIYVQRISGLGFPQWTGNGQAVSTPMGDQNFPKLTSDGADGVLISWSDYRSGSFDIYARRVDVTGLPRWTADGVEVCGAAYGQFGPQIVSDGAGGALIAWYD
ncbi:MAG: hypothetical protein KAT30_06990, partial [Candidatus Krumholzibacteria bacterium]|nr:hypothetical protein [Candidatus Krumholzibacteria bacterium]